jgi:hypothetical protein
LPDPQLTWTDQTWAAQVAQDLDVLTRIDGALDIACALPDVRDYLLDFARHVEWAHTYLRVDSPRGGPAVPGQHVRVWERQDLRWDKRPLRPIADCAGADPTTDLEIKSVEERRLAWRATWIDNDGLAGTFIDWIVALEPVTAQITTVRLGGQFGGPRDTLVAWMNRLRAGGYPLDVLQRQADRALHNVRTILEIGR